MKLHEGSRTKGGYTLVKFLTDERPDGIYARGAWLVPDGETRITDQPGTEVHGLPYGTIATMTMLGLMEWEEEAVK